MLEGAIECYWVPLDEKECEALMHHWSTEAPLEQGGECVWQLASSHMHRQ